MPSRRSAQVGDRIDRGHIDFGGNIIEFCLHHRANVEVAHCLSGSCSSLAISARNSAPALLYHYTNDARLSGIIKSGQLRSSDIGANKATQRCGEHSLGLAGCAA
jgi:hypothetical protein